MMNFIRYEPKHLLNTVNTLFSNPFYLLNERKMATGTSEWLPLVDIREEAKQYVMLADLPGVSVENIDIHIEKNLLTIKGLREKESVDEEKIRCEERFKGVFYRQFTLPEAIDSENIVAKTNNGVLQIIIPKKEYVDTKKIKVISS